MGSGTLKQTQRRRKTYEKSFAAILIALAGVIGSAGEQIDLFQNREAWTLPASSGWKDDTLRVTVLPNNHN
ncbi:MAG: hypothetical protein PUK77_11330, partial [bacterium]|nr:hypothetical protein [bacterium]